MSVAFTRAAHATANAAAVASVTITITVDGTNPVLLVSCAANSLTATFSPLTWSGGGGTPVKVVEYQWGGSGTGVVFAIFAVPAPGAATNGTITITPSTSLVLQADAAVFSGADQTTPCPGANAVTAGGDGTSTSYTLTPASLAAGDATYGGGGSATAGNPAAVTPNSDYFSTSTNTNFAAGYATGTTPIVYHIDTSAGVDLAMAAVRIVAAAGAGGGSLLTRGTKELSGGMADMTGGMSGRHRFERDRPGALFLPVHARGPSRLSA